MRLILNLLACYVGMNCKKGLIHSVAALMLLFSSNISSLACGDGVAVNKKFFNVSFGDSINVSAHAENADHIVWKLLDADNKTIRSGKGLKADYLHLAKPGKYAVVFAFDKKHSAQAHSVKLSDTTLIHVSPVRAKFLTDEAKFSQRLVVNSTLNSVFVEIPVKIEFYNNVSEPLDFSRFHLAGTSNIQVTPEIPEISLTGTYIFKYVLKGGFSHKGYYALIFFNHINNDFSIPFEVFEK